MAVQGYGVRGGLTGRSYANSTTSQWGYDGVGRLNAMIHGAVVQLRTSSSQFGASAVRGEWCGVIANVTWNVCGEPPPIPQLSLPFPKRLVSSRLGRS